MEEDADAGRDPDHLLSERAACERLRGVGLGRRHGQRVLASGLAGAPIRLPSAVLYPAHRVDQLLTWRPLDGDELDAACPGGVFIGRRALDPTVPAACRIDEAGEGWSLDLFSRVWILHRVDQHGSLPFVVTVGGFVALGADIVGLRTTAQRQPALELREPGAWFGALQQRRLVTGAGPTYLIRGWHPSAGGAHPRSAMGESTP